jgi:hypothetical protein
MSIDIPERAVLEQIAAIASESGEGHPVTANQVACVLAAYRTIHQGDPPGTIRRDPETKAIAHRVAEGGVHLWRISAPDGDHWNDMSPTLEWPEV